MLRTVVRYQNQLLLLVLSLIVFAPSFWLGHIPGDSSKYNVAWLAEFSDALFGGVLYPRWLPGMNAGLGGADFYFYGPMPFYLGAPFTLIASEKLAVVLLSWLLCLLSGLAMYRFARDHVGLHGGALAAIFYMIAPYHLILAIMTRNVIGEQAAFIFMPLALAFADQLGRSPRAAIWLALAFAGLAYSHLATTLLFTPLLVVYCLLRAARENDARILAQAVCAGGLGVLLTAAYVLPALTLDAMIFPAFWDALKPDENFLFAETGEIAGRIPHFRLILHLVAGALIAGTLALMLYLATTHRQRRLRFWGVAAILYILLNFEISAPLWNAVDLFDRIQFPWRSLTVVELCAAMLAAYAIVTSSFWLFLAAMVGFGVYQACQNLFRFAATDAAPDAYKPKAMSYVLAGGLAAAFVSPALAATFSDALAPTPFAGAYLALAGLNAIGALPLLFFKRAPATDGTRLENSRPRKSIWQALSTPGVAPAILCSAAAYGAMTLMMASTSGAMIACGHAPSDAVMVISAHVLAMFGPSFFTGSLILRFGHRASILAGLALMAASALAAQTGLGLAPFSIALILLGVGWNFAFIGSSALLEAARRKEDQARVQAVNEVVVFGLMAIAALASGGLLSAVGWSWVTLSLLPVLAIAAGVMSIAKLRGGVVTRP